jgi:hypothetical protein
MVRKFEGITRGMMRKDRGIVRKKVWLGQTWCAQKTRSGAILLQRFAPHCFSFLAFKTFSSTAPKGM